MEYSRRMRPRQPTGRYEWSPSMRRTGHRELRLGFDTQARLLETVVLVFESGDEMVIHAMPARKQYWDLLP